MGACCKSCAGGGGCDAAALGVVGAPGRWYRVYAGNWGQIGWYFGSADEKWVYDTSRFHVEPCEHTGAACLPFPGAGDDIITPRPRFWQLWDPGRSLFAGWLHSDSKGALLVRQGAVDALVAAPAAADAPSVPPPPVGRPDDGSGWKRWAAGGLAVGAAVLAFIVGR